LSISVQRYDIGATPLREGLPVDSRGLIVESASADSGSPTSAARTWRILRDTHRDRDRSAAARHALGDDAWEAGILSALASDAPAHPANGNEFHEGAPDSTSS